MMLKLEYSMTKFQPKNSFLVSIVLAGILMNGCATMKLDNSGIYTGVGTIVGAGAGVAIAHATGGNVLTGAAVGAAAGGALGYWYGKTVDMDEAEKLKQASVNAGGQSTIQTQVVSDKKNNEKATVFKSQEIKIKNSDLQNNNPKVDELLSLTESIGQKDTISQIEILGDSTLIQSQVLPELSAVNQNKIKISNQKSPVVTIKLTAAKIDQSKS